MISDLFKQYGPILISSWANITYLTSFSGFSQTERECFLLFTKNKKYLITDGRYTKAVEKKVKGFRIIGVGAGSFLQNDSPGILGKLKSLAVEENDLTVSEYNLIKKHIKKVKLADLSRLRIAKGEKELVNIKKACGIADRAFGIIIKELKLGVTEKEVANRIEQIIKGFGAEISFSPIVAFGKNSAFPHHLSTGEKLKKNSIVLLDFGAKVNNYCSDMSRTVFFGKPSKKFIKMYTAVLETQQKSINFVNSCVLNHKSIHSVEVDKVARDYIIKRGFPNIPHSVGHGIGIQVHEPPYISPKTTEKINSGMVFSIEPGIYDPSFGGVRIEDLVVINNNKLELISRSRKEIIRIGRV